MISLKNYINGFACKKVFVVIKPGSLQHTNAIINRMKENGWSVDKTKVKLLTLKEAKKLYLVHKEEEFYNDLCKYMSSDISRAFIFCKDGKSDEKDFEEVAKIKDEIRDEFGESDMRNVMHSSDSKEAMEHEAKIYFNLL